MFIFLDQNWGTIAENWPWGPRKVSGIRDAEDQKPPSSKTRWPWRQLHTFIPIWKVSVGFTWTRILPFRSPHPWCILTIWITRCHPPGEKQIAPNFIIIIIADIVESLATLASRTGISPVPQPLSWKNTDEYPVLTRKLISVSRRRWTSKIKNASLMKMREPPPLEKCHGIPICTCSKFDDLKKTDICYDGSRMLTDRARLYFVLNYCLFVTFICWLRELCIWYWLTITVYHLTGLSTGNSNW